MWSKYTILKDEKLSYSFEFDSVPILHTDHSHSSGSDLSRILLSQRFIQFGIFSSSAVNRNRHLKSIGLFDRLFFKLYVSRCSSSGCGYVCTYLPTCVRTWRLPRGELIVYTSRSRSLSVLSSCKLVGA